MIHIETLAHKRLDDEIVTVYIVLSNVFTRPYIKMVRLAVSDI